VSALLMGIMDYISNKDTKTPSGGL